MWTLTKSPKNLPQKSANIPLFNPKHYPSLRPFKGSGSTILLKNPFFVSIAFYSTLTLALFLSKNIHFKMDEMQTGLTHSPVCGLKQTNEDN